MIDILILAINSDIPMLTKSIEGARRNISDGVNEVFVIAPKTDEMLSVCKNSNVNFINEVDSIGFSKNDFDIGNKVRNGWLYQQLLKLNGDKIASTQNFLVLDADHVLLKEHKFVNGNKFYFYSSNEYHEPYFKAISKLFASKYHKIYKESFISDKMVFNKGVLSEMKEEIEGIHSKEWWKAIIDSYERSSFCGFSEFETYGTYISNKHNDRVIMIDDGRLMCFEKRIEKMTNDEIEKEFGEHRSITEFKYAK